MVVKRQCSFCAQEIEPGTGLMFVKRDGTVFHFCSSSCRKQQLDLGRVGHRFKWTRAHALKRAADRSSAQRAAPPPAAGSPAERATPGPSTESVGSPAPTPAEPKPSAPAKKPRTRKKAEAPAAG